MKTFVQRLYVIAAFAAISMLCLSSNCIMASETGTSVYKAATTNTEIKIPEVPYVGMPGYQLNSTKLGHYTVEKKITERTYIYLWYESDIIDDEHLQCKAEVSYYNFSWTKLTTVKVREVKLYNEWKKYSSYNKSNSSEKETTYSHEPSVEGFSNEEDFYDYYYYDFFDYEDAAAYYRKHGGR